MVETGEIGLGLVGGFMSFLAVALLLAWFHQVERKPVKRTMPFGRFVLIAALLAPMALVEEVIFRWGIFGQGQHWIGVIPAFILAIALFWLAHVPNGRMNFEATFNLILVGLILGMVYWFWGLWIVSAAHYGWNLAEWGLGYTVSGEKTRQYLPAPAIRIVRTQPYGPEAHWVATIVLACVLVLVLLLHASVL